MWSESEINNFKKIFLDELGCYSQNIEAEKVFDETFEKARNLDFSEVHDEKLEMHPDLAAYLKTTLLMTWPLQMKKTSEMQCVLSWENLTKNWS